MRRRSSAILGGAAPAYADNRVGGGMDLQKTGPINATDYTYKTGFGPIEIVPDGSKWAKPGTGTMLFGLPNQLHNLNIEFAHGGIDSVAQAAQVSQSFQLLLTGVAKFDALTAGNPTGVAMSLNLGTGLFNGSLKLTDPKPVGTGSQFRTVSYFGMMISHLKQGYGSFLLPGLATGSDVLSGHVLVKAP